MRKQALQININPSEQELHEKIDILSGEVSRLEEKKKDIDFVVENTSEYQIKAEESKVLLEEIMSNIEGKRILLSSLSSDVDILLARKKELKDESDSLDVIVSKKKEYISDMETIKKNFDIMQGDLLMSKTQYDQLSKLKEEKISEFKSGLSQIVDKITILIQSI